MKIRIITPLVDHVSVFHVGRLWTVIAWKNSQPEINMQLSQSIKLIQLIYYLFGSHTLTT